MKYIASFILLYCCIVIKLGAQVRYHSDSLLRYASTSERIDYLLNQPALLWDSTFTGFGDVRVYYQTQQADFRTAQMAQQTRDATFEARGYNKIGSRTYVSGYFLYRKNWEDSLTYNLGNIDNGKSGMPHYYFVPKAGKFERQTYQGKVHVGYAWNPARWRNDIVMDYKHNWATRSVDPRMEFYNIQLILKPSVSYRAGRIQTTLQGIWGYANSETSLSYKYAPYTTGNAYPEYQHQTSYGYGSISLPLDSGRMRQYDHYRGLAILGEAQQQAWKLLYHVQYLKTKQENTNDQRRMVDYYVKQRFDMEEIRFSLLATRGGSRPTALRAEGFTRHGSDFNATMRSKNFVLDQWGASLNFSKAYATDRKLSKEFGLGVNIEHDQRKDGATSHDMQRTWMDVDIPLSLTYAFATGDRLRWHFRPAYRISLTNELTIPTTQINVFSQGIAYPEFYYYGTNALSLQTRIEYLQTKIMKNYHVSWFADFTWTRPQHYNGEIHSGTINYRGDNARFVLGINFFL